jgi:hypothetical protein
MLGRHREGPNGSVANLAFENITAIRGGPCGAGLGVIAEVIDDAGGWARDGRTRHGCACWWHPACLSRTKQTKIF